MNEMEEFLNLCAVVKIRRSYDDELLKFIELIKSVGFLKEYIENFEKNCCFDKTFNEFSENTFWHLVELNKGNINDTCIEFQWSKGFTWGNRKDYLNYNSEIKILNIDELIRACNKEELFKMNYTYTSFKEELSNNKESAFDLDDFLCFYDWRIVKYPDGKYNIKDEQCNTFDFQENTTFDKILNRVYYRMFDYFMDEEDIDGLIEENEFEYVKRKYESYVKIGLELKVLNENNLKVYNNWFKEREQENIEINNDI